MSPSETVHRPSATIESAICPEEAWRLISKALGRIGFKAPSNFLPEPNDSGPGAAPLMSIADQVDFAEQLRLLAPDYFRQQTSTRVGDALRNSRGAKKAFGETKLPPSDIGCEQALRTEHEQSFYMRLLKGPASTISAEVDGRPVTLGLRHLSPTGERVDRVAFAKSLVKEGLAFQDRSGKFWLPKPETWSLEASELSLGDLPDIPTTAIREARIIDLLAQRLTGSAPAVNDPHKVTPTNEFICVLEPDDKTTPIAVATVAWSAGHRAVHLASRRLVDNSTSSQV